MLSTSLWHGILEMILLIFMERLHLLTLSGNKFWQRQWTYASAIVFATKITAQIDINLLWQKCYTCLKLKHFLSTKTKVGKFA